MRLIDIDSPAVVIFLHNLDKKWMPHRVLNADEAQELETIIEKLGDFVIDADSVPVIRCKDCKWSTRFVYRSEQREPSYYCFSNCNYVISDGYCNFAERKEES